MGNAEVEAYLQRHIPLSAAMFVRVVEAGPERVVLRAPLEPNLNHQSTAFGGSVAALGILAGWTLVHLALGHAGAASRTVIQRSDVRYTAPVSGPFDAVFEAPDPRDWHRFLRMMERSGRGRLRLSGRIEQDGTERATIRASYVSFADEAE